MFDPQTNAFLADLAANNSRDWFTQNRARYDTQYLAPAKAFADAFAAQLERRSGAPVDTRLFRIHRDVRFAKDKTPYNTHVHIAWRNPGAALWWMFGLEVDALVIGFGCFGFGKDKLDHWRRLLDSPAGAELQDIVQGLTDAGLRIDPPSLKRVPAPFDKDHPRGVLLRHKELAIWKDALPLAMAYGDQAPAVLAEKMDVFEPLRHWFTAHF